MQATKLAQRAICITVINLWKILGPSKGFRRQMTWSENVAKDHLKVPTSNSIYQKNRKNLRQRQLQLHAA